MNYLIECKCDCTKLLFRYDKHRTLREYIKGHNLSKGGKKCRGYFLVPAPNHPNKDKQGYVSEHHLVYEHYLKILFDEDIYIPKGIDIHHINGNKLDNNIINLIPLTHSEHTRLEKKGATYKPRKRKDTSNRFCLICDGKPKSYGNWYRYNNGFICNTCHDHIRRSKNKK